MLQLVWEKKTNVERVWGGTTSTGKHFSCARLEFTRTAWIEGLRACMTGGILWTVLALLSLSFLLRLSLHFPRAQSVHDKPPLKQRPIKAKGQTAKTQSCFIHKRTAPARSLFFISAWIVDPKSFTVVKRSDNVSLKRWLCSLSLDVGSKPSLPPAEEKGTGSCHTSGKLLCCYKYQGFVPASASERHNLIKQGSPCRSVRL